MIDGDGVRTIDAGTLPDRYARGWHCLGLAETYRTGGPHAVEAFGTKLVVFADSAGAPAAPAALFPHQGGGPAPGPLQGEQGARPVHPPRRGGGRPGARPPHAPRGPRPARTRSWLTLEQNKQLFVWNDPQGNPPPPEVTIPRIEGAFSPEWSNWTWNSLHVPNANCREIIDNVVDMAHFFYIHFAFPTFFKNVFEGHVAAQYLNTRSRPDVGTGSNYADGAETTLRSEAAYYGPSYMIDNLWHDYHGMTMESVLINCHYPVTPNSFLLQWGAIVKKPAGVTQAQGDKIAAKFAEFVGLGFLQDVEIWKHKAKVDNPLLCAEDGPVYQLRRWYDQFYTDIENITPEMVERHEFEIDTTRPVQSWEAEVAANLAARAEQTS